MVDTMLVQHSKNYWPLVGCHDWPNIILLIGGIVLSSIVLFTNIHTDQDTNLEVEMMITIEEKKDEEVTTESDIFTLMCRR